MLKHYRGSCRCVTLLGDFQMQSSNIRKPAASSVGIALILSICFCRTDTFTRPRLFTQDKRAFFLSGRRFTMHLIFKAVIEWLLCEEELSRTGESALDGKGALLSVWPGVLWHLHQPRELESAGSAGHGVRAWGAHRDGDSRQTRRLQKATGRSPLAEDLGLQMLA